MNESDIIRLVRQIIKKELAKMMMASVQGQANSYLTSIQRFATDNQIDNLRIISPYGFGSIAPSDTDCLISPINNDPSHLVKIGDFDNGNRPMLQPGESCVYGPEGQIIYLDFLGNINMGSYIAETGTIEPIYNFQITPEGLIVVQNPTAGLNISPAGIVLLGTTGATSHGAGLGDIIETRLTAVENALQTFLAGDIAHTHPVISLGSPTGPPTPTPDPFVPVQIPVASVTVMISE